MLGLDFEEAVAGITIIITIGAKSMQGRRALTTEAGMVLVGTAGAACMLNDHHRLRRLP